MTVPEAPTPQPSFLVLMATRNGQAWIGEQLRSVLAQQGVRLRVRISDDASSDRTRNLIDSWARQDPRLELLDRSAPSGSACANFLRLIRDSAPEHLGDCTHVAFCDQDDVWFEDKLERAARRLDAADADLYSAAVTARWPSGRSKTLSQSPTPTVADFLFEGAGQGCTFVLRRALFVAIRDTLARGPKDIVRVHYHDWLVYAIVRIQQRRWVYDTVPVLTYSQHEANDTGARGSFAGVMTRTRRIASGWYRGQVDAMIRLCTALAPEDPVLRKVARLKAEATVSWLGRVRWCAFLLSASRRRPGDRCVLAAFAALGRF